MNGAPARPLSIYLVAAEESGDALGAALVRALRAAAGGALALAGVGGRAMAAEGVVSPFPIDELAIVGVSAIPARLPLILRRIRETADAVVAARPDALVIIDSPDFTHRVARRVRARAPSIPIVDYVSPSVWAWRSGRARAMRAYVDCVLAILPFEPAAHRRLGGPPCVYVGHPLIERLSDLRPDPREAERRRVEPAAGPGLARQPLERNPAAARGLWRRHRARAARGSARWSLCCRRCRIFCSARPRRRCRLGGQAAHRHRAGGKMGGISLRARGARGIGHGDARTGACRRADGGRLSTSPSLKKSSRGWRESSKGWRASSSPILCLAKTSYRSCCSMIAPRSALPRRSSRFCPIPRNGGARSTPSLASTASWRSIHCRALEPPRSCSTLRERAAARTC